jgi:hypothetical protein
MLLENPNPVVATGGTGAYAGARGTLTATRDGTDTLTFQ